jgi:hypothetical protein
VNMRYAVSINKVVRIHLADRTRAAQFAAGMVDREWHGKVVARRDSVHGTDADMLELHTDLHNGPTVPFDQTCKCGSLRVQIFAVEHPS